MNHREVPLDGVRGLAILLVFLHHVGIYGGLEGRTPLDRLVARVDGPVFGILQEQDARTRTARRVQ